ncbi:MAG TPA: alpha/beta fold hydrolase [Solirubrobacteraceae bacterium]|nr:alpha/beta fold hydrolase [Solirubrobacteraceae bacterium]
MDVPIPPACGVPPVTRRGVDAAVETAAAAVRGVADYWANAISDARSPLDMAIDGLRWWQLMTDRRPPRWSTRHRIVRGTPLTRLRDFSSGSTKVVPTLVLPPQAGHDSCIVDYSPDQSQMRTIRAAGLERLYALDWIGATQATKDATITDYLGEVAAAVDQIGGPVNLVGDCQGGWLATVYACLHPENVNTLTIAGAPIDFHTGDAVIHEHVQALSDDDLRFYKNLVAIGNGVLKGEFLLGGFIVIKPENELGKQFQLLANLNERRHVDRYRLFEDWYKHTQDIAGPFYLWLVEHLFRDNELVRGTLQVDGRPVDLGRIACPINMLAGATDHITPPAQVFALADHVATPPRDMLARTTNGGHLGLFMGNEALREHWPVVMAAVLEHSKVRANPAAARRRAKAITPAAVPIPAP